MDVHVEKKVKVFGILLKARVKRILQNQKKKILQKCIKTVFNVLISIYLINRCLPEWFKLNAFMRVTIEKPKIELLWRKCLRNFN